MWCSPVIARTRQRDTDFADPHNFIRGVRKKLHPGNMGDALIYCVDPEAKTVLYTTHDDFRLVFQHPFLYMAQFETARSVIEVPISMLEKMDSGVTAKPIYIFSIGRCGSTALSRALAHAGILSASEPDLPTQIALSRPQMIELFGMDGICDLLRAMNRSLGTHLGGEFAVKFRSQCNLIVDDVLDAQPDVKVVFILRRWDAWLRSTHKAFGPSGSRMAEKLRDGIQAYHRLLVRGANPVLIWYEDMVQDISGTLRRIGVMQMPEDMIPTRAEDAQAGTSIARSELVERNTEEAARQEFLAAWPKLRPACLDMLPQVSARLGL